MADTMKCARCKETKPLTEEFFPHNKRGPGGWDKRCKACWKEIQQGKRERKATGGGETPAERIKQNADKVVAKAKSTDTPSKVKYTTKVDHEVELVPADLTTVSLARLADMPKDGVEYIEYRGTLVDALAHFRAKYGREPYALLAQARFFLQVNPPKLDEPSEG